MRFRAILLVGAIRFISIAINDLAASPPEYEGLVHLIYLPAGVNIIAMLVLGYSAALGIAVGTLAWNILTKAADVNALFLLAAAPLFSCLASDFVYRVTTRRLSEWRRPTLAEFSAFSVIYAVINSVVHHLIFPFAAAGASFSLASILTMIIGDFIGSIVLFLTLNLIASTWLQYFLFKGD